MKRIFKLSLTFVFVISGISFLYGQGVSISLETIDPHESAILDVESGDKGVLIPRIELSGTDDVTTIVDPAVSLLIYNTATAGTEPNNVVPGFYYWNGTEWVGLLDGEVVEHDPTWEGEANETDPISRTGNVSIGTNTPEPEAVLNLESANQGFLPPRLNLTETTDASPLATHIPGMVVYNMQNVNDVVPGLYVNDGTKWIALLPVIYTAGEGIEINNNEISVTEGGGGGEGEFDPTLIYTTSGF